MRSVSRHTSAAGFTLIELLTVIMISAILLAIGVPSFRSFIVKQRVKSASYELSTTLLFARSEAIKRNAPVTVTPSTASTWTAGWAVTAVQSGTTYTLQTQPSIDGVSVSKAPASVIFQANGRPAAGAVGYWEIAGTNSTRCVRLDPAGLASTSTAACP